MCLQQKWIVYIKNIEKAIQKKTIDATITYDANLELYNLIERKYKYEIFKNRPNPMGDKIEQGKKLFEEKSLLEQSKILYELLQLSAIGNVKADLLLIGGSASSGVMLIPKNITDSKEFILINKSVTGLFEQKVDLLTV